MLTLILLFKVSKTQHLFTLFLTVKLILLCKDAKNVRFFLKLTDFKVLTETFY